MVSIKWDVANRRMIEALKDPNLPEKLKTLKKSLKIDVGNTEH
jgi:hypothetical protein